MTAVIEKQIQYHVFADNADDWVSTRAEADEIIKEWKKDGATNLRIYKETHINEELDNEECVFAEGDFPW